jgi:hypothetical protein
MQILQVTNEKVCIQFKMLSGLRTDFFKLFTKYEEQVLAFANDSILDENILA